MIKLRWICAEFSYFFGIFSLKTKCILKLTRTKICLLGHVNKTSHIAVYTGKQPNNRAAKKELRLQEKAEKKIKIREITYMRC